MDFEQAKKIISETLNADLAAVTPEARLTEDLGADSLAAVELAMALEEAFGVAIPDEDIATLKTVSDLLNYIQSHME